MSRSDRGEGHRVTLLRAPQATPPSPVHPQATSRDVACHEVSSVESQGSYWYILKEGSELQAERALRPAKFYAGVITA